MLKFFGDVTDGLLYRQDVITNLHEEKGRLERAITSLPDMIVIEDQTKRYGLPIFQKEFLLQFYEYCDGCFS